MMAKRRRDRKRINPLEQNFVERIRSGSVLPILSSEMMADLVLSGHGKVVEGYAEHIDYPLEDRSNLLQIAKYKLITEKKWDDRALKFDYLDFVKDHICDIAEEDGVEEDEIDEAMEEIEKLTPSKFASRLGYPKLRTDVENADPLSILADLPLPIYLTTSPYTFLEAALENAQKSPTSDYCRWHVGLEEATVPHKPTVAEPLVFHLFGIDTQPASLLLTDDDYLRFLVAIAQDNGKGTDPIPDSIKKSIVTSATVLLGFELSSWAFRILFWGLLKQAMVLKPTAISDEQQGVCCLQVRPNKLEEQFLQNYLEEASFEVFWGDVESYIQELKRLYRS